MSTPHEERAVATEIEHALVREGPSAIDQSLLGREHSQTFRRSSLVAGW